MKYAVIIVRVLLGLVFVVFGSNGFLHFMGPTPVIPGDAGAFIGALVNSGYIYFIAGLEVIGGLLLLLGGRFVALGLTALGPVIVNIMLFHIFSGSKRSRSRDRRRRLAPRSFPPLGLSLQILRDFSAVVSQRLRFFANRRPSAAAPAFVVAGR